MKVIGGKRIEARKGDMITLDKNSQHPVVIKFIAVNGNGINTSNENDLSVSALVTFDNFKVEIGGDLSGENTGSYKDIESTVAKEVGQIDVYKVHHHCSSYSSNKAWLDVIKPTVGIISVGANNDYGHPAESCLSRLHDAGVKTYWTEKGSGGQPDPAMDKIAGNVIVEAAPGALIFTVTYDGNKPDEYQIAGVGNLGALGLSVVPVQKKFGWAKSSHIYHDATCPVVKQIKQENLVLADTPPIGRKKHDCPEQN